MEGFVLEAFCKFEQLPVLQMFEISERLQFDKFRKIWQAV
jgi:hypothetical protein